MKKTMLLIIVGLVLATTAATAYRGWGMMGHHHEEMEDLMEEGTYQDLVDYREEIGWNMMPWVDSEEEFQQMQERHEAMEQYHEQHDNGGMHGCHGGYGHSRR